MARFSRRLQLLAILVGALAAPLAPPAVARGGDLHPAVAAQPAAAAQSSASSSAAAGSRPTVRLWATRVGLVGQTTANGHVIVERDHFVALPSKKALNRKDATDYMVQVSYRGRTTLAPVWDVGPWNSKDDYWSENREQFPDLPRWVPQAEAAFFSGHNGGRDEKGRFVTLPASIDLADGTFTDDLGMSDSDWVEVSFLWLDGASPPARPTPHVSVKTAPAQSPPTAAVSSTGPALHRAASYTTPNPASRVFLPLVMHNASGWTTPWTVQNPAPTPIFATAELYDASGARVGSSTFQLPGFGSDTMAPSDVPGVSAGFMGSAVITATGPVAVVVNQDRDGMDRMAYEAFTGGAASVAVPLVLKEYNGWSTGIQVQNLGNTPATVQLTYVRSGDGGGQNPGATANGPLVTVDTATIPSLASISFYQPSSSSLPSGFIGSALVQAVSGQPLAAVVNEVRSDGSAMAYPGIAGGGAERLAVPLLMKHAGGWDTGLQLFNLGAAPALATVTYQGTTPPVVDTAVVPGNGSTTLYQPAQGQLPDGYTGSAVVAASPGMRLVGMVNAVRTGEHAATNYTVGGAQPLSAFLVVPLAMHASDDWETSIQVQNPTDSATRLVTTFYAENGTLVYRTDEALRGGATRKFDLAGMPEIPDGFRGSAVIQSLSGPPLTAVVNETSR